MVDVEIDDQHAIQSEFLDGRRRPHGHVVEDAKAHRLAGQGVVSRRTHQAQCGRVFAADHPADRVDHGSRGQRGNVETARAANGIRVQIAAARTGEGPNLLDIGRLVDPGQATPITRFGRRLAGIGRPARFDRDAIPPFAAARPLPGGCPSHGPEIVRLDKEVSSFS